MLSFLKNLLLTFNELIKLYTLNENYIYKIEEINECTSQVVISCRGKRATLVTTIDDIGYDHSIINFLPAHHACWIGYYFGKTWSPQKNGKRNIKENNILFYNGSYSTYKIIGQNRSREIIYLNTTNGILHTTEPLELAESKAILKFHPFQAFYIGFLAAIESIKISNKKIKKADKCVPNLKIVKRDPC